MMGIGCTRVDAKGFLRRSPIIGHNSPFYSLSPSPLSRLNSPAHKNRWQQIQKEIGESGTYQLSETELTYGAKLAWRNAYRCIGRIQWSKLQVGGRPDISRTERERVFQCQVQNLSTREGEHSTVLVESVETPGSFCFLSLKFEFPSISFNFPLRLHRINAVEFVYFRRPVL